MSLGTLIAFIVLILVVVAFVFAAAMPGWLPLLMIGLLAFALLVGDYKFPVRSA